MSDDMQPIGITLSPLYGYYIARPADVEGDFEYLSREGVWYDAMAVDGNPGGTYFHVKEEAEAARQQYLSKAGNDL